MSRWHPPSAEPKTPYITAAGYARLRAEYDRLWRGRRPAVVRALAAAAAEGDRSENAEYQYRKKELREIDRRVHYLQQRLPILKVAEAIPSEPQRVFFGACVELFDEARVRRRYRIVGSDETDAAEGRISIDSPLARALLKRRVGEIVTVALPAGDAEFEILSISYGP